MKPTNILIILLILLGVYYFAYFSIDRTNTGDTTQELKINELIVKDRPQVNAPLIPADKPKEELPEDIQKALAKPESHDPNELPADLQAQLNAPPPELPEDLKRQLALPPQELPEDLKAQLNSPPPELPEDIKKALSMPPRVVTLDEVNTPPDLNPDLNEGGQ